MPAGNNLFDQQAAEIRRQRQEEDLTDRTIEREADINAQAEATATALQEALTPLLGEQSALKTAAEKQTTAAENTDNAATKLDTSADKTDTAATKLDTVAQSINDSDIPGAIDLVRESAKASLRIAGAIEDLPGILSGHLEGSFERIFDDLQKTIVDILQIESGIQSGVGQFLINSLIESEGAVQGALGTITTAAFQALGIDPEQFTPPEDAAPQATAETAVAIEALANTETAIPVEVTNSDDIYDPERIKELQSEGLNNREIGQILRASAAESLMGVPEAVMQIPEAINLDDRLLMPAPPSTEFAVNSVSISAQNVSVSGNLSGEQTRQPPQPINVSVEASVNLNDNVLLEQQSRTTQLNDAVKIN